jgi:hypothetical protein
MGYFKDYLAQKTASDKQLGIKHPSIDPSPRFKLHSSFIVSTSYDYKEGELTVIMNSGKIYTYANVSLDKADGLTTAASPGAYYDRYIKIHKAVEIPHIKRTSPLVKKILEVAPPKVKPTKEKEDTTIKDVLGTAWGIAELAIMFAPLPFKLPVQLAIAGTAITGSIVLEKYGIDKPPEIKAIMDVAVGYSIYAGLRGITARTAEFYAGTKTPFFNAAYKAGKVQATVTPAQASMGIIMGGKTWKNTIVGIEERRLFESSFRSEFAAGSDLFRRDAFGNVVFDTLDDIPKAFDMKGKPFDIGYLSKL